LNLSDYVRREFAYNEWANREVLNAIRSSRKTSERALQLLGHILSAERLWLERLKTQPQSSPVWPQSDLSRCEAEVTEVAGLWREYLELVTSGDLSQSVSYKNSKGESWSSTVGDIVTHVVMHSAYHRGQIASLMRENGETPAYTDFIHGIRTGLVK